MIKCPKCGTENKDQAKFCANCGYQFKTVNQAQPDKKGYGIQCPHCGKVNSANSKFCRYCGTPLTDHSDDHQPSQPEPQMNYSRQQYRAQQSPVQQQIAVADNYFADYFRWFKDTVVHPLSQYSDNPYFGVTSFGITVFFLWIAEFLSTNNGKIFNEVTSIFGYIPTDGYFSTLAKASFKSPLWLLILTLLTIATYWCVAYVSDLLMGHPKANVLFVANHLAGLTNLATVSSFLVILGAVLNSSVIVWLFISVVKLTFITGLFYAIESAAKDENSLHISKLYLATLACLASYVIQGLILLIIGDGLMG